MVTMGTIKKIVGIQKFSENLTLERVLSTICYMAGTAFMIVAILGLWRHFFTMGLSFAIGIMISDSGSSADEKGKRRD